MDYSIRPPKAGQNTAKQIQLILQSITTRLPVRRSNTNILQSTSTTYGQIWKTCIPPGECQHNAVVGEQRGPRINTRVPNVQDSPAAYNDSLAARGSGGHGILDLERNQPPREVNGFETPSNSRHPPVAYATPHASTPVNAGAHHPAPPINGSGIGTPVTYQRPYLPGLSPQATYAHATQPPAPYPSENPPWVAQLMNKMDTIDSKLVTINERVGHLESEMRALHILQNRVCEMEEKLKSHSKLFDGVSSELEQSFRAFKELIRTSDDHQTYISQNTQRLVEMENRMMRENLLFIGVQEERDENPEAKVAKIIQEKIGITQPIEFERVHRIGSNYRSNGRPRTIVARFSRFKDKEAVRISAPKLRGTNIGVHEQFGREVNEKRRILYPRHKQAREEKKFARLVYDYLIIDNAKYKDARAANSRRDTNARHTADRDTFTISPRAHGAPSQQNGNRTPVAPSNDRTTAHLTADPVTAPQTSDSAPADRASEIKPTAPSTSDAQTTGGTQTLTNISTENRLNVLSDQRDNILMEQ
ncbi:RING finger protein 40 [Elysia marginata]|uniref:RING finger protein 40 n=1 Tax=Elysia marginata TaxID=1093978 RepID=A0AAV4JEM1_9GAST|nr:RING finger protein 40 [Elysia marginata]